MNVFVERSQNCEKRRFVACLSFCFSAWNISAPNGRIFMKFDTRIFFENTSRKLKFN